MECTEPVYVCQSLRKPCWKRYRLAIRLQLRSSEPDDRLDTPEYSDGEGQTPIGSEDCAIWRQTLGRKRKMPSIHGTTHELRNFRPVVYDGYYASPKIRSPFTGVPGRGPSQLTKARKRADVFCVWYPVVNHGANISALTYAVFRLARKVPIRPPTY